jgi:hypothetical protein
MPHESDTYAYSILPESPAQEDGLSDKIHQNVADQLLGVFESSKKGIAIGLEGKWGSGKSTIINLLKQKLNLDEAHVYIFDAWAHEGDPLRRIFLEGLISSIQDKYEFKNIDKLKSSVSGRTKTVHVKSRSKVSRLGKFIGISGLFLPLGAAILSAIDYSKLVYPFSESATTTVESLIFWVGFITCLSPLFVLIYWSKFGDKIEKNSQKIDWSVISGSSDQDYTQDITEDGERSSIEFEEYFKNILSTLFDENPKLDKVIVVLDNLDRVNHESAKSVWSSLQPFFQYQNGQNSEVDKLWFIVPHDKSALCKIWDGESEKDTIGQSFIDKSLQINIDVPLPIHSSWGEYLTNSIEFALLGYSKESKNVVNAVYKRYASNLSQAPTPRKLRQYVNHVGVVGFKWKEQVSIEAIALYALLRSTYSSDALQQKLISNNIFSTYSSIGDQDTLLSELSGMLFGVSPKKGIEILLGQQLSSCILNKDIDGAKKMVENHPAAIEAIIHAKWSEIIPSEDHTEEYKINFTQTLGEIFTYKKDLFHREVIFISGLWSSNKIKWDFTSYNYTDVLEKIKKIKHHWSGFEHIMEGTFLSNFENPIRKIGTEKYNENELKNSIIFYEKLKLLSNKKLKKRKCDLLTTEIWKSCLLFHEKNKLFFDFIQPPEKTIESLINDLEPTQITFEKCNAIIKSLTLCGDMKIWSGLKDQLEKWTISTNRAININEIYTIWIWALTNGFAPEKFEEKIQTSNFITRSNNESLDSVLSSIVFYAKVHKEKILDKTLPTPIMNFWKTKQEDRILGDAALLFITNNEIDLLWHLSTDIKNLTAASILKNNLENPKFLASFEAANRIDEFTWLKEEEKIELANKLISNKSFEKIEPNIKESPSIYSIVLIIFNKTKNEDVINFTDRLLFSLPKTEWLKDFKIEDKDSLRRLVNKTLSVDFKDAFEDAIKSILLGNEDYLPILENFNQIKSFVIEHESLKRIFSHHYLSTPETSLPDSTFSKINSILSLEGDTISEKDIVNNVDFWLKQDLMEHLKWFCSENKRSLDYNETITNRIINSATNQLKNEPDIRYKLANLFGVSQELEDFLELERTQEEEISD